MGRDRDGLHRRPGSPYWYISFIDENGVRRKRSTKTTSKTEARVMRQEILHKVRAGELGLPTSHSVTVRKLSEEYLKWAKQQRAFETKEKRIEKWVLPQLGDIAVSRLTLKSVEQLQQHMLAQQKSPATVNRVVATLKHMVTKAVAWEMVAPHVLARVRQVKMMQEDPGRLRYLSREEADKLVACCDDKLAPIVILALNTGMRRGELLALTWEDVDLTNGFIHVRQSKSGKSRGIPINTSACKALKGMTRYLDSPWLFWTGSKGKARKDIKSAWGRAVRKAQISDFRFHDLRHYAESGIMPNGQQMPSLCGADLGSHSA